MLVHTILQTQYGDDNLDGKVNFSDFLLLQSHYGKAGGWAVGDFNGDGVVNFSDFLILQANYGFGQSLTDSQMASDLAALHAFAATVPEPATLGLALLALPLMRRRRSTVLRRTA